jgi:hypothetical protein
VLKSPKGDLHKLKPKKLSHAVMKTLIKKLFLPFIMSGIPIRQQEFYIPFSLLSPMIAALAMSFSSVPSMRMLPYDREELIINTVMEKEKQQTSYKYRFS